MRRISRRGKIGITAGAVAILAVAMAAVVIVPLGPFAHAAPKVSSSVSYTAHWGKINRTSTSKTIPRNIKENAAVVACASNTSVKPQPKCSGPRPGSTSPIPRPQAPRAHSAFNGGTRAATGANAPRVNPVPLTGEGGIKHNFNGLNNDANNRVNGFVVTPPDQGLCVGPAGPLEAAGIPLGVTASTLVVVEPVNLVFAVYSTTGTLLFGPLAEANLFSNAGASGDDECRFDPATQAYFFTDISVLTFGPDAGFFGTGLAVIDNNGYAAYQIDTSVGGTCFPDFPHQGYDSDAFYVTVNQFSCGPAIQGFYAGAMVWGLSKSQLAAEGPVNFVVFGPLLLDSTPLVALAPGTGDATSTEWMANSFPYDQFGNNNNVADTLGLWKVTDDNDITNGSGPVTMTGQIISSMSYAFPVPAASTGNGSVNGSGITSEMFLQPDDSRMEQLEVLNTPSGLRLYTSLDSAVAINSDPSARDGAAWFVIDPTHSSVSSQGIVAVKDTYLLYPSFVRGSTGTKVIDFSMTSLNLNPSTGYAFILDTGTSFSSVITTAVGSGPHISFSDFFFGRARWGDYSAAALDPNNGNIWVADEYVPAGTTNGFDNWGTRIWEVQGSGS